ncbi:PTS sugar transporter subunit IIA [Aminobacter sp. P9b]|uniref:PTS sugar transporter subunit IIA n=1 Tax=Aminobacter sp. P9b TaxID=3133697 RepID=UPI003248D494
MNISDVLQPDDVILGFQAEGKTRLLKEMARHAAARTGASAAEITTALASREKLGSTGLGQGIAIPHAKLSGLQRPFGAFVRLVTPCPFEAIDDQDVDIVVLLLLPEAAPREYLNLLSRIVRTLREPGLVAKLRQENDTAIVYRRLLVAERTPSAA